MERPGTGLGGQRREIARGDAGTHQNFHIAPGGFHQLAQQLSSLRRTGGLPAGKDGGKAQFLCGGQRGKGVPADVKGTVQGAGNGAACSYCRPAGSSAGKCTLTCYVTQTLVFTFLFFGWGLGLAQDMGPWPCLCAAVAVFLLQAWACRLWLSHFLYGPLEWLWRTATMCRMQPFCKRMSKEN